MANPVFTVKSSPHIRSNDSIQKIMRDVLIALLPAAIAGIYYFKFNAFMVILMSVLSCMLSEAIWQKMTHQKIRINDYSAAVTGLLLGLNLPASVPLWIPVVGGAFAIIIVKQFFGGLGNNFMNPALAARAFLVASWAQPMTVFKIDGVASATPLAILKSGGTTLPSLWDVFTGNIGGCIGETSALALLIGAAYLLYRRVITWHTPLTYIGTVFVLTTVLGRNGFMTGNAIYEIFAGGLMIGAFFMATDYSSSPITPLGQIIMGAGCGILTTVIRLYGGYPEGVSYSILIMNLVVPFIDKYTSPRVFGK